MNADKRSFLGARLLISTASVQGTLLLEVLSAEGAAEASIGHRPRKDGPTTTHFLLFSFFER